LRKATAMATMAVAAGACALVWLAKGASRRVLEKKTATSSADAWEIPSNPTAGADWDSAVALSRQGDPAAAAAAFALGAKSHPADAAWPQAQAVCWARAGRHDSALASLDRCLSIASLSPEAKSLRRYCRLQLGFEMTGAGQAWRGRQLGEAALQDFPDDSDASLLVGYSHAMDGSSAQAETILEKLMQRHPGQSQGWAILVQCALRRGDADKAERWISELASHDPRSIQIQPLRLQLSQLRAQRPGTSDDHLLVTCLEPCPAGLQSQVLSAAEDAWNILRPGIGFDPPDRVAILVGGTSRTPEWAAASYDGQVHIPLEAAESDDQRVPILRHELTHAFLAQAGGGRVPLWLNEGLAQFYQGERIQALPGSSTAGWLDSLASRRTFLDLDEDQAELAYHYSLAVAQELMELHNSTALEAYLKRLREGIDEQDAFRGSFGDDYARLSARIRSRL